jgi:hypothetical protein
LQDAIRPDFLRFSVSSPSSFPELHYVLENTAAIARSLDQLMLEMEALMLKATVSYVAVIVSLGVFSLLLELALVLALFRPAVNKSFSELRLCIGRLMQLPRNDVRQLHSLRSPEFFCGGERNKINPDATISREKSRRSAVGQYYCVILVSSLLILVLYFALSGLLDALQACTSVLSRSRREYLWNRQLYLSEELLLAHTPRGSLALQGDMAGWTLGSPALIRCQLESAIRGLLAQHYAVLYGGEIGWISLPLAYLWFDALGRPLQWGDAWKQVTATVWNVDVCWPFTWNRNRLPRVLYISITIAVAALDGEGHMHSLRIVAASMHNILGGASVQLRGLAVELGYAKWVDGG